MLLLHLLELVTLLLLSLILVLEPFDLGNQLIESVQAFQLRCQFFGSSLPLILALFLVDCENLVEFCCKRTDFLNKGDQLLLSLWIQERRNC